VPCLDMGHKVIAGVREESKAGALPSGTRHVLLSSQTQTVPALFEGVEAVVHLASRVHLLRENPDNAWKDYLSVNAEWTEKLARSAAEAGVRRFVFVSTIKVHGESSKAAFKEIDPLAPVGPYARSKMEAEARLWRIADETSMEIVILRPPLVYGPGVKANFYRLLQLAASGIPLPLASVDNRRTLIYLDNLVDALCACTLQPEATNQVFLVGDGQDFSTPGLIAAMANAMGRRAILIPFPPSLLKALLMGSGRNDLFNRLCGSLAADTGKIRSVLGWTPPRTAEEGIAETVGWFISKTG
jgi:nucleoside-diphosphate-sugar epimerase